MSRNRIIDLLAEPPPEPRRNRLSDLMDQPSTADVNAILDQTEVRRGGLVPLVEYASGRVGYGWPEAFRGDLLPEYMFGGRLFNALQEGGPALQEAAGHTAGYGIGATGITAPIPKPSNSLGIFGGRLAKTADHAALARAEEMTAQGLPREQIWSETGWFQGVDGKWRFEIDDSLSTLQPTAATLSGTLKHDLLYDAYPSLRDVETRDGVTIGRASYHQGYPSDNIPPEITLGPRAGRTIVLHEGQHAVQDIEGMARGGNEMTAFSTPEGRAMYAERINLMRTPQSLKDYARSAGFDSPSEAAASYAEYLKNHKKTFKRGVPEHLDRIAQESVAKDFYRRLAGEVEARAVQARINLSSEQRRARVPWLDYDVPEADQIVRRR